MKSKLLLGLIGVLALTTFVILVLVIKQSSQTTPPSVPPTSPETEENLLEATSDEPTDYYVTFTLNTQDFSYPELSAQTVERLLDLHETYQLPVTIFFTTTMVDYYSASQPDLFERVLTSPLVSIGYHIRPPVPYHPNTPHAPDLSELSIQELQDLVRTYETHGLDLVTGKPTTTPGGFAYLVELAGDRPYIVGVATGRALPDVLEVYEDLGAVMFAGHSGAMNLGDTTGPLYTRPEQSELKAFEHTGEDASALLAEMKEEAETKQGSIAPFFLNIKMHDNDFFAEQSAWTAVYLSAQSRRFGPPYNLEQVSELLSIDASEAQWKLYEDLLRVVAQHPTFKSVNIEQTHNLLP